MPISYWGRAMFLQAVEDLAPEVLVDLKNNVHPIWQQETSSKSGERWRSSLSAWAERWRLPDPWCLE
jgi:hypothetical protein